MAGEAPPLPRFDTIAAELRKLRIALTRLPGEYAVNFRSGADTAARFVETLDEAFELGRSMADAIPAGGRAWPSASPEAKISPGPPTIYFGKGFTRGWARTNRG